MTCSCELGSNLCRDAVDFWAEANVVYFKDGYSAWKRSEALADYNRHIVAVEQARFDSSQRAVTKDVSAREP